MVFKFRKSFCFFIYLSILVISFHNYSFSQEYWIHKPSPVVHILNRLQFTDTLYGWASGDSGSVIHTTDGGQNWAIQNTGVTDYQIDDMFFLNRRLGWALYNTYAFNGTRILSTTNGGLNWQVSVFPDSTRIFSCIYFNDSLNGYIGAYTGEIYRTANSGLNWTQCSLSMNGCQSYLLQKLSFSFLNSQTGYVSGGFFDRQGIIWKTTDSGVNWNSFCVAPEPVNRILVINHLKIMSTGGDREFGASTVQSLDGGNTWFYDTLGFFGTGNALAYRTPKELWVPLTFSQTWAVSLDSGSYQSSWQIIPSADSIAVYDAVFKSPSFGWACGTYGGLLKYNSAIIGISEKENIVPYQSMLYQNYPNPFNPQTTIKYYISKIANVRMIIYDITGREVMNNLLGVKSPGNYEFKFSSKNYASGVYIYKLQAGDFSETKKMVILK